MADRQNETHRKTSTSPDSTPRRPAGTPAGGQFARVLNPESKPLDLTMDDSDPYAAWR